jgi:preprotein translocase subunit SecF
MLKISRIYKYLFILSGIILIFGIVSLSVYGLKLGIDFKGGSISEFSFQQRPDIEKVRASIAEAGLHNAIVQTSGETGVIVKTQSTDPAEHAALKADLGKNVGAFEEKRFESIGPTVGKDLAKNAIYQLVLVSLGIMIYLAYAFRRVPRPLTSWQFGIAALVALFHDLLIVLGIFSLLGHYKGVEVDSLFVTAMLTVLGFSVHDTIVVFDRIRENLRVISGESLEVIVNHSISQTVVRSLNTSLSVLLVLLAMLLFGGESIYYFVLALFIGIIAGTYSSIFVASPILVIWQRWRQKKA